MSLLPYYTTSDFDPDTTSSLVELCGKKDKGVKPAPAPGTAQVIGTWGFMSIPRNSFIGVSDQAPDGDNTYLFLAMPLDSTHRSDINSWEDLITRMEASKPTGGYNALVISGHGLDTGGVGASAGYLNLESLTAEQLARLKALLKDGAPVLLFGCYQANELSMAGNQDFADSLGHPVIGNKDQVGSGNFGFGDWVRFNPK